MMMMMTTMTMVMMTTMKMDGDDGDGNDDIDDDTFCFANEETRNVMFTARTRISQYHCFFFLHEK